MLTQGLMPFLGLVCLLLANLLTDNECEQCDVWFGYSMAAAVFFGILGFVWKKREISFKNSDPNDGSLGFSGV
jgi:cytochrome b